ncbi:MAG: L,D-transpeptidase family protein [Thermodesulfobacteriota bacterium]
MNKMTVFRRKRLAAVIAALALSGMIMAGCIQPQEKTSDKTGVSSPQSPETLLSLTSGIIRQKVDNPEAPKSIVIDNESVKFYGSLPALYRSLSYQPVWVGDDGPKPQCSDMVEAIQDSYREGLNPDKYNIKQIDHTLSRIKAVSGSGKLPTPELLAELDILLSNSFLKYASDLLYGQISPEQINLELVFGEKPVDLNGLLVTAVNENKIDETLNGLLPDYPVYGRLKTALVEYREYEAAGGWKPVPGGQKLRKGARGERVTALKERLVVTGELDGQALGSDVFDQTLEEAVRKYQETNGLYVDGVVGDSTLESLNVPASERVNQIELTLERWRILPKSLGQKFVLVNIANYHLYAVENNKDSINMRIVVGKPKWNTPIFSEQMTHIVLNPYWNIPPSIFRDDIAPMIKSDPDYMANRNIQAVGLEMEETESADETVIASAKEEYLSKVLTGNYRLRQNPGPSNPLGRVKFLFPNKHSVYLHDTPNRGYFQRAQRNFSHGCIRVEKPIELAEFVLASDPGWTDETLRSAINRGSTRTVDLPVPVTVYIMYFTAWANEDGSVSFHKDIYGLDQVLQNALLQSGSRKTDLAAKDVK